MTSTIRPPSLLSIAFLLAASVLVAISASPLVSVAAHIVA